MKRIIFLLTLALLTAGQLFAQGSIRGNVQLQVENKGEVTLEPFPNAEVYVVYGGNMISTRTNEHGDFTLRPLEPGVYNVTINSYLVDTVVIIGIRVTGNNTSFIDDLAIRLGRQLPTARIIDKVPLKNESPSKEELKGSDFTKLADPNLGKALELFGSTWVSDDGRQISFRGARIGDVLYIVDGVKQRSTNVSIPSQAISVINVWHGGVPAQYGDFMGGVVVIETMSYFDWENQQEVKRLIRKKNEELEKFKASQSREQAEKK